MITLEKLTVNYADSTPLDCISHELVASSIAIMGPSGSGKSTLLRVVAGLQAPTDGTVLVDGEPIAKPGWRSAGDHRVSLIHQDYRLVQFLTVSENLGLAAEMRGLSLSDVAASSALDRVGLSSGLLPRKPATLSGGEQQRVAIARSLACGARVILADEPTGALDAENTDRVADILLAIGSSGECQVVIATHDPTVASRTTQRYGLSQGNLWEAS